MTGEDECLGEGGGGGVPRKGEVGTGSARHRTHDTLIEAGIAGSYSSGGGGGGGSSLKVLHLGSLGPECRLETFPDAFKKFTLGTAALAAVCGRSRSAAVRE